jgi:hypothetical protein
MYSSNPAQEHQTITPGVVDPDLDPGAFILVGWIQIRIRIGNTDPDPGGPKLLTKVKKIQVLSARCSLLRNERKTSPGAWTPFMEAYRRDK